MAATPNLNWSVMCVCMRICVVNDIKRIHENRMCTVQRLTFSSLLRKSRNITNPNWITLFRVEWQLLREIALQTIHSFFCWVKLFHILPWITYRFSSQSFVRNNFWQETSFSNKHNLIWFSPTHSIHQNQYKRIYTSIADGLLARCCCCCYFWDFFLFVILELKMKSTKIPE